MNITPSLYNFNPCDNYQCHQQTSGDFWVELVTNLYMSS